MDIFDYLIKYGADVDVRGRIEDEEVVPREEKDLDGVMDAITWRVLMQGAKSGNTVMVENALSVFLKNDSKQKWLDVADLSDDRGRTVLHWAAFNGDTDSVDKLIKHGAKTDIVDNKSQTPGAIAEQEGHKEIVELCIRAEKARLLEKKTHSNSLLKPKKI